MKTISIDAMGGDYGPKVVIPAALQVLKANPDLKLIFVGDEKTLRRMLRARGKKFVDRYEIVHASQTVAMDELPSQALRTKKDSSMRVAINLVKEGRAQACVSAGNTGALMATARFVLKTLPGIDRPAIITSFPTHVEGKITWLLDIGANVDSKAEHLFQFAVMGAILAQAESNLERPTVGLLNIGQEEIKGNEQVKQTAELLAQTEAINYIGFVEGDDIFSGLVDVVVCDGFVGNVAIKTCEGVARLIGRYVKESFKKSIFTRLAGLPALPILTKLAVRIDPRRLNGATFIGINGTVIKSHGGAGVVAFAVSIEEALLQIEKNVPEQIRQQVSHLLEESTDS